MNTDALLYRTATCRRLTDTWSWTQTRLNVLQNMGHPHIPCQCVISQISACDNGQNIMSQCGFWRMLYNIEFNTVQLCGRQITSISYGERTANVINGVNMTRLMGTNWISVSGLRFPLTSCYRIFASARGIGVNLSHHTVLSSTLLLRQMEESPFKYKKVRQCTYSLTLSRSRVTIIALESMKY